MPSPTAVITSAVLVLIIVAGFVIRRWEQSFQDFTPWQIERDRKSKLPPAYRRKIERSLGERLGRAVRRVDLAVERTSHRIAGR